MPINEPSSEALIRMEEMYAKMYYFLAHEIIDRFQDEGRDAIRAAIRKYGHHRGTLNRERHQKQGIPINLVSLFTKTRFPSQSRFKTVEHELTPERWQAEVFECPLYQIWKELGGLEEGSIYCEEVHEIMWQGYEPRVTLSMPKILTHQDDRCVFEVTLKNPRKGGDQ